MKHLDLGCGYKPKNPYGADELYGVDIYPEIVELGDNFRLSNLATEKLPFKDSFFDSVSAFDVLEHVPRQAINFISGNVRLPFIELMNEVSRVLKSGGLFYAYTPVYPNPEVFLDPTHVNFITRGTHEYFCGDAPYAKRYGFIGKFEIVEVCILNTRYASSAERDWKINLSAWYKTHIRSGRSNLIWQLRAVKQT